MINQKTILIIEDDMATRKFLCVRLKESGFGVAEARDGVEGFKEARRLQPDLIILDLSLPRMSGEEVCKAIREDADKRFAGIPIIMLTGKNSDVDRVIGHVIGANRYITKPYQTEGLLEVIGEFVHQHS
jgi:DNA-binding response OmpR family regulator